MMIERGESDHVPLQFRQHAWLREVNDLCPPNTSFRSGE